MGENAQGNVEPRHFARTTLSSSSRHAVPMSHGITRGPRGENFRRIFPRLEAWANRLAKSREIESAILVSAVAPKWRFLIIKWGLILASILFIAIKSSPGVARLECRPASLQDRSAVAEGGLDMSYGGRNQGRAIFAGRVILDRIREGAKPAGFLVQAPNKFRAG